MDQLRAIKVFVRVIDEGSFAAAARALDLAPAVVTRLIAELEEHLGTRLLNRTTRRLSLTEIGEAYLERARRILADVDEAAALAASATQEVRGLLRVLCPPAFAVHQLAKHLPAFHRAHPLVTVEITSPGPVETVGDGYDLTIFLTRSPLDGDFVARRLARSEFIMCASPDYLDRRGRPQHPRELKAHDALLRPTPSLMRGLTLQRGDGGEEITLPIAPLRAVLATAHMDTNYAAALHGLGIAGLPSFMVEEALLEQALERVMPQWRLFSTTLWAGMPTRKYVPARTRAFLDFLLEIFGGEDEDPWLVAAGCATRP
ncbi:MAG: LysR substrate-binding domain-containing protein [Roseateles sp.]|uniref:LysR family transcriptional regulator n=1 Tax=Roseateles sp. TaxID=1971397 RepID=UPI0039E879DB